MLLALAFVMPFLTGQIQQIGAMLACMGFDASKFGMAAFISGAITTAVPGIVLQIVCVPVLVLILKRSVKESQ